MDPNQNPMPIEKRTYRFALQIIRLYRANPAKDDADRVMWRQLLKSGTSPGANTAEGPGAQSRPDWRTKRFIALKEMRESHYWLQLLRDANNNTTKGLESALDESNQLVAILTTICKNSQK
jgi:four helix bundle protein